MKNNNSFIMGIMVALFMSAVMVSCDGFSNDADLAARKIDPSTPTPDPSTPDPDPSKADTINWGSCVGKGHKVYTDATVRTWLYGHHGGKDQETILDSLVLRYNYVFSLKADTTIYLETAPKEGLSFSSNSEGKTEFSEYSKNEQGDSVCTIRYEKPYTLSNGVPLSLKTERVRGWHMMGGRPELYSEPTQSIGRMTISSSLKEVERNDSIFGVRTNICSVPITLGGVQFTANATITEIWYKGLKDGPEPSYDIYVNEPVAYVASSMAEISKNNWRNVHLLKGKTKLHAIVCVTDVHNAKVGSVEDKPVDLSRVVVNKNVNGAIYDAGTGLFIPAQITPDNTGWSWSAFIDSREIVNTIGHTQAIEEGIKSFMETNTSKPTPFFYGVKAEVTTWKEYKYTTITWVKYSKDGESYTNQVVVKSPK